MIGDYDKARAWALKRFEHEHKWPEHAPSGVAEVYRRVNGTGYESVIWLERMKRSSTFDIGVAVHEANHVTIRMLNRMGIDDEETHCYLLHWLVQEILTRAK